MSVFGQNLVELNGLLQILKELHYLTELIPELQEGENRQIIREFRIRMIDKLLERIKDIIPYDNHHSTNWSLKK